MSHFVFSTSSARLLIAAGAVWLAGARPAAGDPPPVLTGIDVLVADQFAPLKGKRVGLVTNPTGVTWDLRSTVDVLHAAPEVTLVALFGPEHGVRGEVSAGDHVEDARDAATGVPAYSLYGKNRKPSPEVLEGIDVLVYDIQDNGARSYTYISTMGVVMEAAAAARKPFMVLDRPNPLTGHRVEGRPLDMKYKSFVGHYPIPYVYGLTCGELAKMINEEGWLEGGVKCDLTVIPMRGWKRSMWFEQTGQPWVISSPHVPDADSALYYASTGIFGELHVLSEGVGYTMPFELAGAPFVKAEEFARDLSSRNIPGVRFRPLWFKPYYGRLKEQLCGGVQIYFTDRNKAPLTHLNFHAMDAVRRLYPSEKLFGNKRDNMFDKVCGTDRIRTMFEEGRPIAEILEHWNSGLEDYMTMRAKYLMYE